MLSRKDRTIRYALALSCLVALLAAQIPGATSARVMAQSKGGADLQPNAVTTVFGPVTVTNTSGLLPRPATPYPGNITVSGLTGGLVTINMVFSAVTISGGGGAMDDIDIILVSPGPTASAHALNVWSESGGTSASVTNVTLTDSAGIFLPNGNGVTSNTSYKPTESFICNDAPVYAADAGLPSTVYEPGGSGSCGAATFTTVFKGLAGAALNGTWKVYMVDHSGDAGESVTVSLDITAAGPTAADSTVSGATVDDQGNAVPGTVVNLSGTQNRKFISDAAGNYRFDNVETNGFYTVRPSRANFAFSPAERSFSQIGNKTEATFAAVPSGRQANPLDTPEYFVRQHYLDFLGREPDEAGFNFWSDQILSCGADAGCGERRTINVSAAYFQSIEFQQTGGLVDGLYRASYGRAPRYAEFMPDTATVAQGVVVGTRANWAQTLESNKQAFVDEWMQRSDFRAAYDGLANDAFVDALISHTRGFNGDRSALANGLNSGSLTRAAVLRQVVENEGFTRAKSNQMFVMMEYFGYLRRDPDAGGFGFWLDKLNQFGGNFEKAEMVKSFIVSGEYRDRFPR